jgi:hypothetical protein
MDPSRGMNTYKSYRVDGIWTLGYIPGNGETVHGVRRDTIKGYNILRAAYNPSEKGDIPILKMQYEDPFWELKGREWELFKKRVISFSEKNDDAELISSICEEALDDLRLRLTGRWL